MEVLAEFTIEPFVDGSPGRHVKAGIDAARRAGVEVEVGPFGTSARGELDAVTDAVALLCRDAVRAGAGRISMQLTVPGG